MVFTISAIKPKKTTDRAIFMIAAFIRYFGARDLSLATSLVVSGERPRSEIKAKSPVKAKAKESTP